MQNLAEIAMLMDIYGDLLTKKQKDVMDLYYNHDLSLGEIAENQGITRQGVYDLIKRGVQTLRKTDKKLGMLKRWSRMDQKVADIISSLDELDSYLDIQVIDSTDLLKCKIHQIRIQLENMLN